MNNGAKKMSKYEVSDNMPIPIKTSPNARGGDKNEVLALKLGNPYLFQGKPLLAKTAPKRHLFIYTIRDPEFLSFGRLSKKASSESEFGGSQND
jgi:hypothetical protein